jgi:purine-nucleoside/S-methyl-5'-thioadenosine phosphorylase / adenosine deaminase
MLPLQTFPALATLAFCRHGFVERIADLDMNLDRASALIRLGEFHAEARRMLGLDRAPFITAEQVHGAGIAVVDEDSHTPARGVDGLVTDRSEVCLGIYVADCAAVYLIDPVRRCIGLVHSGKRGTELGVVPAAIEKMRAEFGAEPARMIAQISPCIRPPHYEVDFAAEIARQCRAHGIEQVHDCGENTGADLQRYYSYRIERGKTGRMLALLALT